MDRQVQFVRRHSEQFGYGAEFAIWIERRCPDLVAVYSEESRRLGIYRRQDYNLSREPLAIWDESPKWSLEPGRLVYLNGRLVCAISRLETPAGSPADVDALAHRIVELLNKEGVEL